MLKRLMHYKIQDSPNPIWLKRGKKNDYFKKVIMTFMGRDALNVLLYNVSKKSVLLPVYVCKEVTSEFIRHGYKIHYYDINSDFTINIDFVKKIIIEQKIEVFYYVVYFGIYSKYNSIAKQIKTEIPSTFIIEDRAHYLSNQFDFLNCDAYIYSFRKSLPIAEGGGIASKLKLQIEYKDKLSANILPIAMFVKKMIFGYSNKFTRSSFIKDDISKCVKPISILSNKIIQKTDYEKEYYLRRKLYYKWIEKLLKIGFEPLFLNLDTQDIPLGCPIRIKDAAKVQSELEKKGYYLKRHWLLNEDFKLIAPNSFIMSKNTITLPIYRGINEKDQNEILILIKKYIKLT